ncbi:Tripartite tricarboxylate transporter family receptor [Pigmentiphaga humi]|uniref:Tripartite tricarboxylate transporter family receptor n=1 Tax=Pigmentiphaga humi TaxID=2478468 RepID=A0A3P4B1D2_9BURK|nr:tripartite tricarboxylate transporter substrate binding protein [Pigmentiphaga humi]VCU69386.1 Tripartite tricarboxylate transporter family receptor [Pigmentiphaga humi]
MKTSARQSVHAKIARAFNRRVLLGVACVMLGAAPPAVHAQAPYPARPVTLLVPYNAGGSTDLMARVVAQHLGQVLGKPVVVENRGGVGSTLGTGVVAKAAPDGYTLLMSNGAAITTGPLLGQRISYDPLSDFTHIMLLGTMPNGFIVRKDSPAKDFKQFLELARASGGRLNYGSAGVGSIGFLTGEMLKQKAHIEMTHVPYKGTGPAMTDLIGGQIDVLFNNLGVAFAQVKAGNARVLAVSGTKRLPEFPDVPTMNEFVPGVVGETWFGIAGPKGMPPEIANKLKSALETVIQKPEVRKQLSDAGLVVSGMTGAEFGNFLTTEHERWDVVIKPLGVKLD